MNEQINNLMNLLFFAPVFGAVIYASAPLMHDLMMLMMETIFGKRNSGDTSVHQLKKLRGGL